MNKNMKCAFGGLENYLIIVTHGTDTISINTENQRVQLSGFPSPLKVFALDEWIIQLIGEKLYIAVADGGFQRGDLFIRFNRPEAVDMDIIYIEGTQSRAASLAQVKMMRIHHELSNGSLDVMMNQAPDTHGASGLSNPPLNTVSPRETVPPQNTIPPRNTVPDPEPVDRQQLARLTEQLREAVSINQELRTENQSLQQKLASGVEQYIISLKLQFADCDIAIQQKMAEVEEIKRQLAERQNQLQQMSCQADGIREQMETISSQIEQMQHQSIEREKCLDEMADLDVAIVQTELANQRERMLEDSDVLALLADDPVLRVSSVHGAIEKVDKILSSVEKRLELVVRIREKIDNAVRDTILRGDGTIASSIETGGEDGGLG